MANKVWVYVEHFKDTIAPASLEALGEARRLAAALGGGVTALIFGAGMKDLAQTAIAHGADEVLLGDDATLKEFRAEAHAALLVKLATTAEHKPEVILAGATTRGRDLLGMASVDFNSGSIADAVQLAAVD